jgi:hypothetical protein
MREACCRAKAFLRTLAQSGDLEGALLIMQAKYELSTVAVQVTLCLMLKREKN